MFSVYGIEGRLFTGSLADLWQVEAVRAITRARPIGPLGQDGLLSDFTRVQHHAAGEASQRNPLAAYAQTEQPHMPRHPLTRVGELMSQRVITVSAEATVLQAWQMLASSDIGQAPVVNGAGTLVGLLSRADLLRPDRLPLPGANAVVWRTLLAQQVADIMWTPVPSVAAETDIRRVTSVLLATRLPGLPVVDKHGVVTGFVSRSDILRAVVNDPPLDLWG